MENPKVAKMAKAPGEVGKTAIQVVERMMNLLDALAKHEDACSLKIWPSKLPCTLPQRTAS